MTCHQNRTFFFAEDVFANECHSSAVLLHVRIQKKKAKPFPRLQEDTKFLTKSIHLQELRKSNARKSGERRKAMHCSRPMETSPRRRTRRGCMHGPAGGSVTPYLTNRRGSPPRGGTSRESLREQASAGSTLLPWHSEANASARQKERRMGGRGGDW
jgi:hypothetical protein